MCFILVLQLQRQLNIIIIIIIIIFLFILIKKTLQGLQALQPNNNTKLIIKNNS